MGPLCPCPNSKKPIKHGQSMLFTLYYNKHGYIKHSVLWLQMTGTQGQTDNSWGPLAIGDHGAPVSLPNLKKAYEKGTRGIS
ncbi:unnamed protein product [Staurois parvus]|uniref:Uncharacterized protein n=1 Tax=Staurois parvus TaxID=386267 RepID=A0ABN9FEY2_9NEOB|nr:unnamed protein product [Staurois parvus]